MSGLRSQVNISSGRNGGDNRRERREEFRKAVERIRRRGTEKDEISWWVFEYWSFCREAKLSLLVPINKDLFIAILDTLNFMESRNGSWSCVLRMSGLENPAHV